jgi:hypothetical protein
MPESHSLKNPPTNHPSHSQHLQTRLEHSSHSLWYHQINTFANATAHHRVVTLLHLVITRWSSSEAHCFGSVHLYWLHSLQEVLDIVAVIINVNTVHTEVLAVDRELDFGLFANFILNV